MPRYTHLLFDNDNTLMDFDKAEVLAFRECYLQFDFPLPYSDDLLKSYSDINKAWWKKFELGQCSKAELTVGRFAEFLTVHLLSLPPETMYEAFATALGRQNILIDGALDLLKRLHSNYSLHIITNGISKVQHSRINSSPIREYIGHVFVSEDVGYNKPDPRYFERVLKTLEVCKHQCIVIGDSLSSDIKGANNSGIDCIWYNPLSLPGSTHNVTYNVTTLKEIEQILVGS